MKIVSMLLVFILGSCIMGTENPFDDCGKSRPLNKKEKTLQKKLKQQFNDDVFISRVSYQYRPLYAGLNCEGFGKEYEITMLNWSNDQINDTLFRRKTIKELALHIYTSVLEDSIKNYIDEFKFTIGNFDSPDSLRFNLDILIKKSDIEKFLGEKLIVKNKQFKFVKITKEKDIKFTEVVDK
ncbi:hypothetical protein [Fluviicola chungangensis]|uniref:Lipoprotein n=1 Tax=Fluviicola chungangensis TaxID=2597671 RepID=A0A556N7V4_9FLAO|nr:hypothetical protein [Fluviicola chungangensis]TSJ48254.1 hypothetical protein FO442_03690 [Fluviicola chungangensis]